MKGKKVCKNCSFGTVDGGTQKRKKREIIQLDREREKEVGSLKRPKNDKEKKLHESKVKGINKDFDDRIKAKEDEPVRDSVCCYCGGTGYRGRT